MKPLPEAVQRAFPREAGAVPSRPWWYLSPDGRSGEDVYWRVDDPRIPAPTVEEVAAYDAERPIPHPGYRAGQVWAREDGSSVVVTLALLSANDVVLYFVGGSWKSEEFARAYPYLMADPACPHLAPWSPVEVKP